MAYFWILCADMEKLNNKGQSTIEYVLLLAVLMVLVTTVLSNQRFQNLLGPNGSLFRQYADVISYTYRHGVSGKNYQDQTGYSGSDHDTYGNNSADNRFAIPIEVYPGN